MVTMRSVTIVNFQALRPWTSLIIPELSLEAIVWCPSILRSFRSLKNQGVRQGESRSLLLFITVMYRIVSCTKLLQGYRMGKKYLLLLGYIQSRAVLPLPSAKDFYPLPYLPLFCISWNRSLGSTMILGVFLFSSYRAVSIGKSSLAISSQNVRWQESFQNFNR